MLKKQLIILAAILVLTLCLAVPALAYKYSFSYGFPPGGGTYFTASGTAAGNTYNSKPCLYVKLDSTTGIYQIWVRAYTPDKVYQASANAGFLSGQDKRIMYNTGYGGAGQSYRLKTVVDSTEPNGVSYYGSWAP